MAKLTDKQHKKMLARYAECQNYSQVAREFNVSEHTVRTHCKGDKRTSKKLEQKKEQNTLDMISYLDSRKGRAQDFLDLAMEYLMDEDKLKRTGVQAIATAMGIVIDKFIQNVPQTQQSNNLLQEIRDGIAEGRSNVE